MAEVAPAPAPAPAKAAKKKVVSKPKKAGPSVAELIVKAVAASKERSGVSAAAVKKSLTAGGYDVEKNNSRVKTAIKSLVTKGTLVQTKGIGASGSFKISKQLFVPSCLSEGQRLAQPRAAVLPPLDVEAASKPSRKVTDFVLGFSGKESRSFLYCYCTLLYKL
uniref:Histone H1 n=1 Tax=Cyclopterus lumpus TaxID=8103 RepID=A0A8C3GB09_CYCLU